MAAYDRALERADVLLMPTTPGVAHTYEPDMALHDHLMRGWALLANTSPTDMTGHPALSLPAAESDGLPVGAMLISRHCPRNAPAVSIVATGTATCENNSAMGSGPRRCRAWVIPPDVGTVPQDSSQPPQSASVRR